jgi:hypothetical protein
MAEALEMSDAFPAMRKIGNRVMLRGIVIAAPGAAVITTLPEGCRPSDDESFAVDSEAGAAKVTVKADGSVTIERPIGGWINLDGIEFLSDSS